MKKLFCRKLTLFLAAVLLIGATFLYCPRKAAALSGTCGDNVAWSYDGESRTLTISGSGEMDDFDDYKTPWGYYSTGSEYVSSSQIQNLVVEDGVTSVGAYAFAWCGNLTKVSLPESITSIKECAFQGCESLEEIALPIGIEAIEDGAFHECSGLKTITIPNSVTAIGEGAFEECSHLEAVYISASVKSIGDGAFYGCNDLVTLEVASGNPVFHSAGNCLIYTELKMLLTGGNSFVIPDDGSVKCIKDNAFWGRTELKSISIPSSVTSIGKYAFTGCSGLGVIEVAPGNPVYLSKGNCLIESESRTLLYGCKNSVIPGDGCVTYIEKLAFLDCSGLESVTIPATVTEIGSDAFNGCTGLSSVSIPGSVKRIGNNAFYGCSGLTSVIIIDGVREIGKQAFFQCGSIKSLFIPRSIESVEGDAFCYLTACDSIAVDSGNPVYHMSGNCLIETESKTLIKAFNGFTIPDDGSVTGIGDYALSDLSLESVLLPESITRVGASAFPYGLACNQYENGFYLGTENNPYHALIRTDFICEKIHPDTVVIGDEAFSFCDASTLMIPDGIKNIGNSAFINCGNLQSVTIPASVARIGDKAFDGCASLTSILVDSGNEYFRSAGNCLIDINEKTVLKGCGTSVIPDDGSVTRIASYAFFDAEQAITLPDCITDIGEKAFNTMKSDTLEEYGSGFYAGTKTNPYYALISIGNNCDIHPGTVIIADSAYDVYSASESSVVELKIPAAVTRIGNYAFSGLNVDSICIPASVKEIGEGAFSQCHPLKTIQYKGTQDEWEKIAIGEDNESLKSADILFVRNNAEETEKPQNENRNPASTGNKKGNDMENGKGYVPFVVVIVSSVIIVAAGGLILFLMRKKED